MPVADVGTMNVLTVDGVARNISRQTITTAIQTENGMKENEWIIFYYFDTRINSNNSFNHIHDILLLRD